MTSLRFSDADALRCRFAVSPLWETLAAVRIWHLGGDRRPVYQPWLSSRGPIAATLDLDVLRAVQPHVGHTPDFLTPPPRSARPRFDTELDRVRATP